MCLVFISLETGDVCSFSFDAKTTRFIKKQHVCVPFLVENVKWPKRHVLTNSSEHGDERINDAVTGKIFGGGGRRFLFVQNMFLTNIKTVKCYFENNFGEG